MRFAPLLCVLLLHKVQGRWDDDEDQPYDPYTTTDPKKREPSPCEVCKFFITELQRKLDETAKSKAVIETGYSFDEKKRKKTPIKFSELRLTEALHEPHICEKILEYNVHAERKGSLRYAKGMSETFQTLHGLVDKGVKVELGIPYDLWDKPSAEVSKMQRICFKMAETYEPDIEEWYYNLQDTEDLMKYICKDRYLKHAKWDDSCLDEVFVPKTDEEREREDKEEEEKKKSETDPDQARRDKDKIDRLIAEQAEEQRIGHKLYKGEMGDPDGEKQARKEKKEKAKKKKEEGKKKKGEEKAKKEGKKRKKNKKGDPGYDVSKDEL